MKTKLTGITAFLCFILFCPGLTAQDTTAESSGPGEITRGTTVVQFFSRKGKYRVQSPGNPDSGKG